MSRIEKLIKRLKTRPRDFTWRELEVVLNRLGFEMVQGSGSRVKFYNETRNCLIQLHKPHPGNILKAYVVKTVIDTLEREKLV